MSKTVLLKLILFIILGTFTKGPICFAGDQIKQVSTAELKNMMDRDVGFTLVNVLPKIIYDAMHLPGSLNFPIGRLEASGRLPFPKNRPLVFYCMGVLWVYSPKAARLAAKMGYTEVMVYREGLYGWAKAGLNLEQNIRYPDIQIPLISSKTISEPGNTPYQLIDIRPSSHFVSGHIKGSENIDLEDLHLSIAKLSRVKPIVLVDHKGKLTLTTGRFLASQGITNVHRLDGGFNAWVKEGYNVARKTETP